MLPALSFLLFILYHKLYVDLIKEQLPELPQRNIITEPEGRNTAPCIALSALIMDKYYKKSNMLVLPSDHLIKDEKKFRQIIKKSDEFINENNDAIITFGINPTRPETGYGYIKCVNEFKLNNISKVERFVEKPNKEKAKEYLRSSSYLWNSGMFLWKTKTIIEQIKKYVPNIYEMIKDINYVKEENLKNLINAQYAKIESISIDYAVLEKSPNIYVVPSEIGWDDIGTWKAVERYKEKDEDDNIIDGNAVVIKSKSNIAINNGKKIVMIGIDNVMVIETEDGIYIINKDYMENIKNYKFC